MIAKKFGCVRSFAEAQEFSNPYVNREFTRSYVVINTIYTAPQFQICTNLFNEKGPFVRFFF